MLALLSALISLAPSPALATLPLARAHLALAFEHAPIGFQAVNAQVYRGGRPGSMDTMAYLAHFGIRTIVNLQGDGWQWLPGEKESEIQDAQRMANQYNMRYLRMPFPPGASLDDAGVKQVLAVVGVMENPQLQPVYVHCNVGADRTGIVIAAYRILHDGCGFTQARGELERKGAPWTPILMHKDIDFLQALAANPEQFGATRSTTGNCTLPQ